MSKKQKKEKKRNLRQITCEERLTLSASKKKSASNKVKVVQSNYGAVRGAQVGFAAHQVVTTVIPKLKDISLVITAKAIRKMQFWLNIARGEFAGFGFSGQLKDPLRITDFMLLDQRTGGAHADLDDLAIALHYNDMADAGAEVVQYGRIWFHTHPFGNTQPSPSGGDDATFRRAFGDCDWSVMLVFSNNVNEPYAEIQVPSKTGILGRKILNNYRLDVDIEPNVTKAEAAKWGAEFDLHVKTAPRIAKGGKKGKVIVLEPLNPTEREYLEELEAMEAAVRMTEGLTPAEQQYEETLRRINAGVHV